MSQCNFLIYIYTNKLNGKSYVGFTHDFDKRKDQHISASKSNKTSKRGIHGALRKYGADNFSCEILEPALDTKQSACDAEVFWIAYLKSIGARLYNLTDGGDTGPSWKGYKQSAEHIRKRIAPHIGAKRSQETLRRMSESLKGLTAGEKHPQTTITNSMANEIRELYATGRYSQEQVGKIFNQSRRSVYCIVNGKTFKTGETVKPKVICCKDCCKIFPRIGKERTIRCKACNKTYMRRYYKEYNTTRLARA